MKTDLQIHQDVLHELRRDPDVDETAVGVLVDNGVVTLIGTVATWAKRLAAEDAADRVSDVLDLANDISVQAPRPTLQTIRAAIEEALGRRAARKARQITVELGDGTVTLRGPVRSWAERRAVLGAARATAGVRAVRDELWPTEE